MNAFAAGVAFVIIWACVFLASLSWGLSRSGHGAEANDPEGVEEGAPKRPAVLKKAGYSFAFSLIPFAFFVAGAVLGWFDPETWPTADLYPSSRTEP